VSTIRKVINLLVFLLIILSACGTSNPNDHKLPQADSENNMEIIQTEGTYIGEIDSNMIEVKTEEGHIPLIVSEESNDIQGKLKEHSTVKISYYKNNQGQFILVNIDKK
jgi:sporulation protein YlmC with PRC-barrel domain